MKKCILSLVAFIMSLVVFSQSGKEPEALGLPGDNLDLYAVLDLFQKSKTIEDFEKTLNDEKTAINNLDLDNDKKVDFIKVVTDKKGEDFTFILRDAVSKTETQDVAVILVSKDKNKKVSMQIVGDEELYGKNYIVEPKATTSTANPAYTGSDAAATTNTTTVVQVQSAPVVTYIYSPVYVPYYPPYSYGYYPPYFHPWATIAFGIYYHNNYYHHSHYHNTVVINNSHHYNHYSTTYRHTSKTVVNNRNNGYYKGTYEGKTYNRPSTGTVSNTKSGTTRQSTTTKPTASTRSTSATKPSTSVTKPSTSTTRQSTTSPTTRPTTRSSGGGGVRRR